VISKIDTAWSEDYQNITVTMVVGGDAERPIMCYRLKGEGAKELAVGDTITVTGIMKNYKGTIEFDAGCTLDAVIKGEGAAAAGAADLAAYFENFMLSLGEENAPFMMPADPDVLEAYYAGLSAIATKQCEVQLAAMSAVAFEFALIECENAEDVEAVKTILEARKAYQVDGGAWYPASIEGWELNSRIAVNGNYLMMIAYEKCDEIVDAFNALFA
jgi:hypothetical protein